MELFHSLFDWYMANLNYLTIGLLMLIESTFLPMPSEVVIPFAAYKAAQGDLNIFLVVAIGTIGALSGSLINYTLAYYLGRPIVYKFADSKIGRILLLSKEKVVHAEDYFNREWQVLNIYWQTCTGYQASYFNPCRISQDEPPRILCFTHSLVRESGI